MKRAILIVMDGCGAGEAPDSAKFGDNDHPNTLAHVWKTCENLSTPTLNSLGLFRAAGVETPEEILPIAAFGRLQEISQGKDSVTGHWEMMGIETKVPFPTYPQGFPISLIKAFENATGTQTLANKPASGTQIIQEFGQSHVQTGFPIVYTSADSVFQIACHEDIVPLEKLYDYCRIARELCVSPNNVQRVIARPFIGDATAGFTRTGHRKDFPLVAPPNFVDRVGDVFGIGVVPELFGGRGFRAVRRTQNNAEHEGMLREALASDARFIFANFEDFDMLYGHRNDPVGFGKALEAFDATIAGVLGALRPDDMLLLTADHGNDPTSPSTDHSREFVPVVMVQGPLQGALGDRVGMMHIAQWIGEHLGVV